jgi:hypothetical protein
MPRSRSVYNNRNNLSKLAGWAVIIINIYLTYRLTGFVVSELETGYHIIIFFYPMLIGVNLSTGFILRKYDRHLGMSFIHTALAMTIAFFPLVFIIQAL